MNFKRNCSRIIALIGSVLLIAGCKDANAFEQYQYIEAIEDSHEDFESEFGEYKKLGDYKHYMAAISESKDPETDETVVQYKDIGDTHEIQNEYAGYSKLKATGERKIVVIPVNFDGFTNEDIGVKKDEYISNLNKAFFGSNKSNKFVSVAEYYNRSSYGQLKITGKVCDQFYVYDDEAFTKVNSAKYYAHVRESLYEKVLNWYKETYKEELIDYRVDQENGTALYLVYSFPADMNNQNPSFFWAYTLNEVPLSWSSYSFMNTLSGAPDAHTYIHETGHLFGLADYYPTEEGTSQPNVKEPTARIDMMDCSVGDHTGLSKMWLNWTRPYWVTGKSDVTEINIKPLVNSGDLILINDKWNGTVFDEYYLVELYSPIGLNYFDTNNGNNLAKLPTLPGVKIYHVDARLAYFNSTKKFIRYCNETPNSGETIIEPTKGNIDIAHDNSTYESKDLYRINSLYEFVLNNADYSSTGCATNINLYRKGDSLEEIAFNSTNLNSQNYKISVTDLSYANATIKIEKIIEK